MKNKPTVAMLLNNDLLLPEVIDPRVYKEAKSLVKNGYEVFVVCRNSIQGRPKIEEFEGIKVYRIPQKYINIPIIGHYLGPKYKKIKTVLEIKKLNPDIIHAHEPNILQIGVLSKMFTKKPLIYDAHEDYFAYANGEFLKLKRMNLPKLEIINSIISCTIKYIKFPINESLYIRLVDHVITVNNTLAEKYRKKLKNTTIINNYREKKSIDNCKVNIKNNFEAKKFVAIFVTKLYEDWGFELLLESAKMLDQDTRITIMCPGAEERFGKTAKELGVENKIIFTKASFNEVMDTVCLCDVGLAVLPTNPNTLVASPNKLFEYMLAGIPVIASNFPMMKQIIEENDCGILVNPESPKELVDAINFLKNNTYERKRMGENGKKAAIEKYNWECQEVELLKTYGSMLKS